MGNTSSQEQKDTNLSLAAEKGEVVKVDQLLKEGADPNRALKDGERLKRTSLHRAAKTKNNVDVLTKLLTFIKDVDATDDEGNTALHLAAGYYNNVAVVQTLLHAKPNCRIQNSKGQTALHSAVERGSDWKVIECLLLADTDPNIADFEGNTALHYCAGKRSSDDMVPGILLRFGANPNIKNNEGQTTLHVAAHAGNKVVLLLLKFHAKVRLRDKEGRKPADLAEVEEIKRILEFEERSLEERTIRSDHNFALESSLGGAISNGYDVNGFDQHGGYHSNGMVTPNGRSTHFWAGDTQKWRACGGDGIIQLPDKSEIVVPPQAVPRGTVIKLRIKPSDESASHEIPSFDFGLYDFELNIKVDLPGAVSFPLDKDHCTSSSPPAFTGFCADGCSRWFSSREVACQRNGVTALQLNLQRKKGEALIYKVPMENRRSSTEVFMRTPKHFHQNSSCTNEEAKSVSSLSSQEEEPKLLIRSRSRSGSVSSHHSFTSASSSTTEEEFVPFNPSNEPLIPADIDAAAPDLNQFDHVQVVVGLPSNRPDGISDGEDSDSSKASAVDAISDFLRQQVDSPSCDSSSAASDNKEKQDEVSSSDEDASPLVELQVEVVDATKQYTAIIPSLRQEENEDFAPKSYFTHKDSEPPQSRLNFDATIDAAVTSSHSSSSSDDDDDDVRNKTSDVKQNFNHNFNNSITNETQKNDHENLTTQNDEVEVKVKLQDKIAFYERLGTEIKSDSSSSSSSESDDDVKRFESTPRDDVLNDPLPVLDNASTNDVRLQPSVLGHREELHSHSEEDAKENNLLTTAIDDEQDKNTSGSNKLLGDGTVDAEIASSSSSSLSSVSTPKSPKLDDFVIVVNNEEEIGGASSKISPRYGTSSSSSGEESENEEKSIDEFRKLREKLENEVRKNTFEMNKDLQIEIKASDHEKDIKDQEKDVNSAQGILRESEVEDLEAFKKPGSNSGSDTSSASEDADVESNHQEVEAINDAPSQTLEATTEDLLHGKDKMAGSNPESKQSLELPSTEDLEDVHKLLLLQENSMEERYQHPIDPALATISEDTEEQGSNPRLRHASEGSSSSGSSSSSSESGKFLHNRELLI